MTTKRLPLGGQGFAEIVKENLVYIDKTQYIYNLYESTEKHYFLARPRRFGKTLLLNTIRELFTGNRELFHGLWIDRSDYSFPRFPVVSMNFSFDRSGPDDLKAYILSRLNLVAEANSLKIGASSPGEYVGELILALHRRYDSKVVVLIDEYDAPVTRAMDDLGIAHANAAVLHDFFARLKQDDVLEHLRFTMVTGITRYAMTSMDSGPNHLNDISLDTNYSGICGFTIDEFDSAYADRLEATLAIIKEKGKKRGDSVESIPEDADGLRAGILKWYNGYDWGDGTRILNPFSINKFFQTSEFGSHWIRAGRPGHLTAMIQKRPLDFLKRNLEPFIASSLLKTGLDQLGIVPALFHSGYLTVDKIEMRPVENPKTKTVEYFPFYTLRLPNEEVSSAYNSDGFQVIFNLDSEDLLGPLGHKLKKDFIKKDAKAVSNKFNAFFSTFTYHQKIDNESTFHLIVQGMLSAMGFKLGSELPGARGRLDLCVKLEERIFLIIELKYCKSPEGISRDTENKFLASLALDHFGLDELRRCLADVAKEKFSKIQLFDILGKSPQEEHTYILSQAILKYLSDAESNEILASIAKKSLPNSIIISALNEKVSTQHNKTTNKYLPEEQIDAILSKAANKALRGIASKDYHGVLALKAEKIIDLGLAIYDHKVMAVFGPAAPAPRSRKKPAPTEVSGPKPQASRSRKKPASPEVSAPEAPAPRSPKKPPTTGVSGPKPPAPRSRKKPAPPEGEASRTRGK